MHSTKSQLYGIVQRRNWHDSCTMYKLYPNLKYLYYAEMFKHCQQ